MKSQAIEVTVESLGGLGDGIATHNGKPLFIPKSCAGDRVKVRLVRETNDAYHGAIEEVIESGPHRGEAPCAYFGLCGGCTLQQLAPEHYRAFKTRIFHESLARAGYPSPEAEIVFLPEGTRRRVEFKVARGKNLQLAFHQLRSHDAVAVDHCLVLRPELQALIAPLNKALSKASFASFLQAVSVTSADSGMEMVLTLKDFDMKRLPKLDDLCRDLKLARICARTPDSRPEVAAQLSPVTMRLSEYDVTLPPDAFLQATAEGQALLTKAATSVSGMRIADLFCGIGTYSFPLSASASVHAVEGDGTMVRTLAKNVQRLGIKNITSEYRDLFKKPLGPKELKTFDAVVLNPPRVGAKAQTEAIAESNIANVVMISCNPATFTRDAKTLKAAGFALTSVQGIDQFLWNQHLEIAAVFTR